MTEPIAESTPLPDEVREVLAEQEQRQTTARHELVGNAADTMGAYYKSLRSSGVPAGTAHDIVFDYAYQMHQAWFARDDE